MSDSVVTLRNGQVLVAGDAPVTELYDPRSHRFLRGPRLGVGLSFATATLLRDGNVLVAGGYESISETPTSAAWVYHTGG